MRAVICREFGEPAKLTVGDLPSPALKPGMVRVAVMAAGLNFADTLMVKGQYQFKPPFPFSPGHEAAGVVREIAPDVKDVRVGQRVMAFLGYGGFAEEVVANAGDLFPIPDTMDFVTAAAFPVAYGTAHGGLLWRAALKPGETLLVLGAAGGVGLAAVEVGKAMGARVIAAARGADKLALARAHGADETIDYAAEDLRQRAKDLTGGKGVDVVLDPVGGDAFDAILRAVNWEGRIVIVGFAAGRIPQIPANMLLIKNVAVTGLFWGAYRDRNPALMRESFATLLAWWSEGRLKPHVSHRLPLERVGEAMELMLARKATGKIVLTTGAP
ncbi:MAG: NADPH:quinone oxidoreductase family protein [Rhodospirillales bacterium]|nr:NADPH:quinone oxidoreductase family protein [Rhodospirillales bacterium]